MAVGKITVPWLLCGILSWLFASPAFAATVDVTMSNLTFQAAAGNNSCGGLPCTETFDITFEYDTSTGTQRRTSNCERHRRAFGCGYFRAVEYSREH